MIYNGQKNFNIYGTGTDSYAEGVYSSVESIFHPLPPPTDHFLLQENGFALLQENGRFIFIT